ncbi:hypothetical protein P691DRAFT_781981 [Macrolepiota fuliginosa MF-IS2]|uniref:F-box domain-containing protein n=1 Tax=Macrolepiota fuliginosa MF-IS2 TaxID=1400762 RepID=A0A9P5XBL5_9AGAR|nr:hypothetical protein P691DRAFT_781981 [Macrolepiota fuliginosa MF-IS2]
MQEVTKIPRELINRITYFCHPSTLYCWSLVSAACLPEAQTYLYRDITFASHWNELPSSQFNRRLDWRRVTLFLASIRQNPQLARLIRELTLDLAEGSWPAHLWVKFLNEIPAMTNLVRFRYICPHAIINNNPTLERLLRGTTTKLRELEIYIDSAIDHDYFAYFLSHQEDLKILSLRCSWDLPVLQPDSCPRLEALTTWSRRCMEAILPERPVVKLCWDLTRPSYWPPDDYDSIDHLISSQLSQALSKIRILILQDIVQDHGGLLPIAPHLPALEVLELEKHSEANVEGVLKLANLQIFVMRQKINLEHQRALGQRCFSTLTALRLLFFGSAHQDCFSRWGQGVEEPINVSYAEITPFLEVENLPGRQIQ